jgi:hypothetical protein
MPRTNIPIVETEFNKGVEVEAANVVATADAGEYEVDLSEVKFTRVLLVMTAASNDGLTYTIGAGSFSDANLGDLEITVADGETFSAVVDSSRFKQSDGTLQIDVDNVGSAATGTITAYSLP